MDIVYNYAFDKALWDEKLAKDTRLEIIKLCISQGAKGSYSNAIEIAIRQPNSDLLVEFLVEMGFDINVFENSALILACMKNKTNLIKLLLTHGADPSAQNNQPIIQCIANDNLGCVKMLIDAGADPLEPLNRPFCRACQHHRLDIAIYLLELGASYTEPSNEPICMAYQHSGGSELKRILLDNGADPNSIYNKYCLLEHCLENCDLEGCKLLFEYGADIALMKNAWANIHRTG